MASESPLCKAAASPPRSPARGVKVASRRPGAGALPPNLGSLRPFRFRDLVATPLLTCLVPRGTGDCGAYLAFLLDPRSGDFLVDDAPPLVPSWHTPEVAMSSPFLPLSLWGGHRRRLSERLFKVNAWGSPSSYLESSSVFVGISFFLRSVNVKGSFKLYLTSSPLLLPFGLSS